MNLFNNITNPDLDFSVSRKENSFNNQEEKKIELKNFGLSFFNLFRSFVAIGILTLPFGISTVGPLVALFAFGLSFYLLITSTQFLLVVANELKFKGVQLDVLGQFFWGKLGYNMIMIVMQFSLVSCYIGGLIFFKD